MPEFCRAPNCPICPVYDGTMRPWCLRAHALYCLGLAQGSSDRSLRDKLEALSVTFVEQARSLERGKSPGAEVNSI